MIDWILLGTLFLPAGVPGIIAGIEAMCLPAAALFVAKYLLALPATYHYFNGIRHLVKKNDKFIQNLMQIYNWIWSNRLMDIFITVLGFGKIFDHQRSLQYRLRHACSYCYFCSRSRRDVVNISHDSEMYRTINLSNK